MPFVSDPAALLNEYGYIAILIGAFLEGETIVLAAGFLAHQGYLHAPYVALAAFCGSAASDQIMFFLARYKGEWFLRRFPRFASGVAALSRKVQGREVALILCFRFIYGMRNVTPVFLGLSPTPSKLFVPLNVASAAIWAAAFTVAGYFFGTALSTMFGRLREYEPYILSAIVIAVAAFWFFRRKKRP